jgi:hypothetical protein
MKNAHISSAISPLSDDELLTRVKGLVSQERRLLASLLEHLIEVENRELHLQRAYSSMFTYLVEGLGFSEDAAYNRERALRAVRKHPVLLHHVADGSLHLAGLNLLAPHLDDPDAPELIEAARNKSKRQVERLLAAERPKPDVPVIIRKLPGTRDLQPTVPQPSTSLLGSPERARSAPALPPPKSHRPLVSPLSPERYRIQFTADAETHALLRRAQDLLSHQLPGGDPAAVVKRALTVLVDDLERKRHGKTERPREAKPSRPGSRHVPAEVKREVDARDGGQCTFVGPDGRRCTARAFIQYHHDEMPHAFGGRRRQRGWPSSVGSTTGTSGGNSRAQRRGR